MYFTYGNHWMFNVSCRPDGECGAVLLRAAFPLSGEEAMAYRRPKAQDRFGLLSGPGKLAAAVGATGEHTGLDLLGNKGPFRLVVGEERTEVLVSKRIGIAKGRGDEMPWRFVDANLREWASRKS